MKHVCVGVANLLRHLNKFLVLKVPLNVLFTRLKFILVCKCGRPLCAYRGSNGKVRVIYPYQNL